MVAIGIFLLQEYMIVGIAFTAWAISVQVVMPIIRGIIFVIHWPALAEARARATAVSLVVVTLMVMVLCFVPLPLTTRAEGVVWVPDQTRVFAEIDGFIERLLVSSGNYVESGDVLVEMRKPRSPHQKYKPLNMSLSHFVSRLKVLSSKAMCQVPSYC